MTVDRLLYEMDEMELVPVVVAQGETRFSDPVSPISGGNAPQCLTKSDLYVI